MPRIIRGIKKVLKDDAIRLQIHAADCDYDQEIDMLNALDRSSVDGAIIYPPPLDRYANAVKELHRRGVPLVLVDTELPGLEVNAVVTDSVESSRMIFEHLLKRGHRHIGMVGHEGLYGMDTGADLALRPYGLSYHKLPCVDTDVKDLNPTQPWANGEKAALQLLAQYPDLTAIVGMNDHIGMGVLRGVKATGRSVPGDVSVIAASNLCAFENTDPNVTAIDQMHEQMGSLAAETLMKVMHGQLDDQPLVLRLKPRLIERDSVRDI
jgi:LacI family transcriptional regulator